VAIVLSLRELLIAKKKFMKVKNVLLIGITILTCISSAQAQNVNIPDGNFKAALVNNSSINTNMDTEIQISEAAAFTGGISVSSIGITDLTGIEAFTLLTNLNCSWNQLTSVNVSANTALTNLNCSYNQNQLTSLNVSSCVSLTNLNCSGNYNLSSLNVSANTALTNLNCSFNLLTSLDVLANVLLTNLDCRNNSLASLNVSANNALTNLDCRNNSLTSLDVSDNTALTNLYCGDNYLTSLNVSANTALTTLHCYLNQLTSLNVSVNTLTILQCGGNTLSSLDLSSCTALNVLHCHVNQLTSLNVSANTALTNLYCSDNQLTSLDVSNGNNNNMVSFGANNNPNLSCIEVDNTAWSNTNWAFVIDPTASFSENCSGAGISDINESIALMFYPNPTTGSLYLSEQSNITLIDLSGKLLLEEKNTNQLDLSALPAGMYFLSFGENNNQLVKVIKE
jgi:Leucine-rich repeat (LRR) protein